MVAPKFQKGQIVRWHNPAEYPDPFIIKQIRQTGSNWEYLVVPQYGGKGEEQFRWYPEYSLTG